MGTKEVGHNHRNISGFKREEKGKRKWTECVNFFRIFAIFVMPDTVNIWLGSVNFKQIRMHHGCLPSNEFNDSVEHDPY